MSAGFGERTVLNMYLSRKHPETLAVLHVMMVDDRHERSRFFASEGWEDRR
jgi:hypothetical protein